MGSSRWNKKGYTLIELIAVIVVMGLLVSLVVPTYNVVKAKTKLATVEKTLVSINHDVLALREFNGELSEAIVQEAGTETRAPYAADSKNFTVVMSTEAAPNRSTAPDILSSYISAEGFLYLAVAEGDFCVMSSTSQNPARTWHTEGTATCSGYEAAGGEPVIVIGAPTAPRSLSAAPTSTTSLKVNWIAPANDNGGAVQAYKVTTSVTGGQSSTQDYTVNNISLTNGVYELSLEGLTMGSTYRFSVAATNSAGTGPFAGPSNAVTLSTLPSTPSLTAASRDGGIYLSWSNSIYFGNSPILGYRVYQEINGVYTLVGSTGALILNDLVDGLDNGSNYSFRVAAYSAAGEGESSNIAISMPVGVPVEPTGLGSTINGTSATISWDAVPASTGRPVTGIQILMNGTVLSTLTPSATSFTKAGLTLGESYDFTVRPKNLVGTANGAGITVEFVTTPNAPGSLVATAGTEQISLAWPSVASTSLRPVAGYRVYQNIDGTFIMVAAVSAPSAVITQLNDGETYGFRVSSYGSAGEGTWSTIAFATPFHGPAVMTGLTTGSVTSSSVTLSWDAASASPAAPVDSIDVLVNGSVVGNIDATSTSFTVGSLTANTSYTFAVRAKNKQGTGTASTASARTDESTSTVGSLPAPVIGNAIANDGSVSVNWSAVTVPAGNTLSGYKVYRIVNGVPVLAGATATRPYVVNGLDNGTSYSFSVSAYNSSEESPRSAVVTSTPIGLPGAVTGLVVTDMGDLSADLIWNAPSATTANPIDNIVVYRDGTAVQTLSPSATSTSVTNLTAGTHTISVSAKNPVGSGTADSDTKSYVRTIFTPGTPTSLTATAKNGSVLLDWSAPASTLTEPRTGFNVYREINGIGVLAASVTQSVATITGLTNGVEYTFNVSAYGTAGESDRSASATATPVGAPGITGLTANLGDAVVTLDWNALTSSTAEPVTAITVKRGGTTVATLPANASTYTSDALDIGESYLFTVQASNASVSGTAASVSVTIIEAPRAPTLTATAADGSVELDWSAITSKTTSPVSGYRVYRVIAGVKTLITAQAGRSYTVTGLTNGTAYDFTVAAYGPDLEGIHSTTQSATPITSPASVSGLNATAGDLTVDLTWNMAVSTAAAPVTSVRILKNGATVATMPASTTTYSFTGLISETSYVLGVQPINGVGAATASTKTVTAHTLPDAPGNTVATANDGAVTVSWSAVTGDTAASVTGYNVYRLVAGVWVIAGSSSSSPKTISSLTNGTSYSFRVAAYSATGEGPRTGTVSATPVAAPVEITGLVATIGNLTASMTWDEAVASTEAPVTGIEVIQNGSVVATLAAGATSYSLSGLTSNSTYTVGVRAKNDRTTSATTSVTFIALAVPAQAKNLAATAGDGHVQLTWSQVTTGAPVSGYNVYRMVNSVMVLAGSTVDSNYDVTGLTNGEAQTFQVAAFGTAGEGMRSANVTATPITDPGTLVGLTATPGNGEITLAWTGPTSSAAAPVTGYRVYRKINNFYQLVGSPSALTYVDSGLTNGVSYNYLVAAYGPNAEGGTGLVNVDLPDLPPSVTMTSIQAASEGFTVNYAATASASQPITGFYVYVNGAKTMTVGPAVRSQAIVSADVAGGLTNATAITVKVCAYNTAGEACTSTVNHTIGVITTGTTPANGTTTFPDNDIFQTFGNGFTDSYPGTWSNPTASGTVTASSANKSAGSSNNGATDHSVAATANTFGAATSGPAYIQWDFGANRSVVPQGIMARWSNASWDTYLEGSTDGVNWSAVFKRDTTMTLNVTATETYEWTNNEAYRYLRIYKKSTPNTGWFNLYEVQIFGKVNLFPAPVGWAQTAYSGVTVPFASTPVQVGQYLYWAGGDLGTASRTRTNKTLRFDMATETFSYMANVPVSNTVASLNFYNNKLYRVGGVDAAGAADTGLHVYNIATDTWTTLAGKGVARYGATTAVVGSTLYVFGGRTPGTNANVTTGTKIDLAGLDAASTWSSAAGFPWANLLSDTVVQDGSIYAFSGYGSTNASQQTTYKYTPASNTWTQTSSPSNALVNRAMAKLADGRTVLAGGMYTGDLSSGAVDVWDGNKAASAGALQWSALQKLTTNRIGAGGGYYNGTFYVVGGVSSNPNYTPINSFEKHSGL